MSLGVNPLEPMNTTAFVLNAIPPQETAFTEAREAFERLGEPPSVAAAWHQIGNACRRSGQYVAAERAYQESLRIEVQRDHHSGEADTLN